MLTLRSPARWIPDSSWSLGCGTIRGGLGLYRVSIFVEDSLMQTRHLCFPLFLCLLVSCSQAKDDSLSEEDGQKVMVAFQAEDYDTVISLTAEIPETSRWDRVRTLSLQRRGEERFFEGKIKESIEDFDAVIARIPEQDPHHWQRGLCYYYAEEYGKGKAQFERHQEVNSQDVENAVWHFICSVRVPREGVELDEAVQLAQENLIPIQEDTRVPMAEIHRLFSGAGSVEEVLKAVEPNDDNALSDSERNHLCYAHLYLALWFESIGKQDESNEHIRKAAYEYPMDHYMGKTAVVHAKLRGVGPTGSEKQGE